VSEAEPRRPSQAPFLMLALGWKRPSVATIFST
jgi:hypothetical protein